MITISVIATVMWFGVTKQSCSGAWLLQQLNLLSSVVQTCSCAFYTSSAISSNMSLYFLHLFNSVPFKILALYNFFSFILFAYMV